MEISLPTETKKIAEKSSPPSTCPPARGAPAWEEHWLELAGGRLRYLKAGPPPHQAETGLPPHPAKNAPAGGPGLDRDPGPPPHQAKTGLDGDPGTGPALILVHGLLGYSFSWRFAIPALSQYATVYAIDNLGAGLSPAPAGLNCNMRATAERLLGFVDALGISSFHLVGTSHGGGVAIMAAAISVEKQDARLKRLVLVAPVNPWSPHGRWLAPFLGKPFGAFLFRHSLENWRFLDYLWLRRLFGDGRKIPPDSLDGYRIPVRENRVLHHGRQILKTWTADLHELEQILPRVRDYPTLLMWGSKDRAVSVASAEPLRRYFRDCRLVVFDGVGHLPYEEAPDEFNRSLIEFLAPRS